METDSYSENGSNDQEDWHTDQEEWQRWEEIYSDAMDSEQIESDDVPISEDDFEKQARQDSKEERREKLEQALAIHAHYVIDVTKYVVPFTIMVLAWHFTLPEWLGWLTEYQKDGLAGFLIGGAGLGIVSTIFVYFRNLVLSKK